MHRFRSHRSIFHSALAALLLLAMQAGQWTGLEHRIGHAGLDPAALHQLAAHLAGVADPAGLADPTQPDNQDNEGYAHSCQLFDAATLAIAIHSGFRSFHCQRAAQDWTSPWAMLSWQAPFTSHFSSRAPPFH
jgi:hypothetical protein